MTDAHTVEAVALAALIASFIADALTRGPAAAVAGVEKRPCQANIRVNVRALDRQLCYNNQIDRIIK